MTNRPPLDHLSEVVDEERKWKPDWYGWLKDLVDRLDSLSSQVDSLSTQVTELSGKILDPCLVSELPGAGTVPVGTRGLVTDASLALFTGSVSGGGSVIVPVYSDGTDWLMG